MTFYSADALIKYKKKGAEREVYAILMQCMHADYTFNGLTLCAM